MIAILLISVILYFQSFTSDIINQLRVRSLLLLTLYLQYSMTDMLAQRLQSRVLGFDDNKAYEVIWY